jgi:hypothetical protein
MNRFLVVVALIALSFTLACPPKAAPEQLPPAGLAGGAKGNAPLTLPGAGMPVAAPSGTTDPQTQLPPGHPPIDGAGTVASAADTGAPPADHPGMPAGHPPMDTTMPGNSGGADGAATLTGAVLETMDVPEYTYMRVKSGGPDGTWVAVTKTPVKVGDTVTVSQSLVMNDFFSKGLNRTFPKLVMGTMIGAPKSN